MPPTPQSARRFFRPSLAPRRVQLFGNASLRTRTAMTAMALFLVFAGVTALVSAFMVNHLKNRLVATAHDEIRIQGEEARAQIERVLAESGASRLDAIANDPIVRAELRFMSRTGGVVLAAMIDSDGNCLFQQFGDEEVLSNCTKRHAHGDTLGGMIPENGDMTWELRVRPMPEGVAREQIPIHKGGVTVGYLEYGVSDAAALGRLEPISRAITRGLFNMVALVAAFLGIGLFLLARVSQRHVALQRQHDEAQRMASIGAMASGLAHEIRNPLHAMNLHLEAAKDEIEDPRGDSPERVQRVIGNVQSQIGALNAILTNFMKFALPGRIETEPVRLAPLVGEVVTMLSPEFDNRDAAVFRTVPDDAWIDADQTAARQVLTNLVLNALQIMEGRERREIRISAERAGEDWIVLVDDTGPGLPPGAESSIFEAFVSHRKGGTGFGLAIARRLMEEQGGAIAAANTAEGGARFILRFRPAAAPAKSAAPDGARRAAGGDEEPLAIG